MIAEFKRKLTIPKETKEMYPLTETMAEAVDRQREELRQIFCGESDRLLLIIGPCSADNEDSVIDYISRLAPVQEKVKDKILIIPRIYTGKPRTTGDGYKGLVHQPDPNAQPDLFKGIIAVRELHMRALKETGFASADEMLYPENYKYIGRDAFDYKGLLRSITFLNPDIVFDENKNSVDPDVTIYGYRNSTAQAYAEKYGCKFRALEDPFLKGDANLDDKVNISDAVLVMQVATNPDKYGKFRTKSSITSKGEELADVDGTPGLTNSDALLIQKYKLGLVSSL